MTQQDEINRYFEVCGFDPDDTVSVVWKGRSGALGWTTVQVSEAWKPIVGHQLVDCWISANPMSAPPSSDSRGTSDDVYAVRALWADLDVGPGKLESFAVARAVIAEVSELIGAQPVVLLASGHGLQPRWRLDEAYLEGRYDMAKTAEIVERFGRLVQKVAERHGGKADSVYDLPRIIRAPGTTNCKDGPSKGIPVRVKFTDSTDVVDIDHLVSQLDTYVPTQIEEAILAVKEENVDLDRGDRYVEAVVKAIQNELVAIESWPTGKTDERGRGWEKIQADAAYRLAELAKADWNSLSEQLAKAAFTSHAPTDEGWTVRDVLKKWQAQWKRAEPASPPAVVDDPLESGYTGGADAPPRPGAPAENIWAGADGDGTADRMGGEAPADPAPPVAGGGTPAGDGVPWRKFDWDEFGAAARVIALHGEQLRWCAELDRWMTYTDGAWVESKTGGEKAAQDTVRRLPELETGLYSSVEYREGKKVSTQQLDFLDWVKTQRSSSKAKGIATTIRNDGLLDVPAALFDANSMLLNARNGVVDLETGELLRHDPKLHLRRQVPVEYDPDAKAPLWEVFLERVMPSVDMRNYLQRIVGYTITGETGEQAIFVHHGPPASGKSVFLRIIEAILGEFSRVVPPSTLLAKKIEQHPTDIAGMQGRRMLQMSETPEGARLDEALIKRLSGEETITARGMGQDFRDFRIVGKVHMATNHLPHITGDPATKRRLHYVGWTVTIPPEERDTHLAHRIIRDELPGVLSWAVRGTSMWMQDRLAAPVESQMAVDAWVDVEDEFGQFVAEELVASEDSTTMPTKQLFIRYAQWCESMRMKPMSHIQFGRKLAARGFESVHTRTGNAWKIRLRAAPTPFDPLG